MNLQNLVDYFVVNGLDLSSGLEPDKLSGDNLHCQPLDRPYKARVLEHYPEAVASCVFDSDAVCMLSHPRGVKFKTQNEHRSTSFHTFIITREDSSKSYGAVLTFYEKVTDSKICVAMKTLQDMHMAELSNEQSQTLYPHSVHMPNPRLQRTKTTDRVYDFKSDQLYVTKSLCLISVVPFVNAFERYLSRLFEIIAQQVDSSLPLESYIYNLIYEIPLPSPGRSLRIDCLNDVITCQRPGVSELPLFDYSLKQMFNMLGAESVLNLFTCFLLEHQILLYSTDYQRLMLVAEGVSVLLFPFSWQHVYVPILPASMMHFLDAPVPFVMGLHHITDDDMQNELANKANMVFVNIDTACVELPEDLPEFPYKSQMVQDCNFWLCNQQQQQQLSQGAGDDVDNANPRRGGGSTRDSGFRESIITYDDNKAPPSTVIEVPKSDSLWSLPNKMDILQQSEAMLRITALAKRTGVITSLDDISESLAKQASLRHGDGNAGGVGRTATQKQRQQEQLSEHDLDLIINNNIREVFLHYFLQLFNTVSSFLIQPPPSVEMDEWLSNRESMQNFDKAAFLGDQPERHLPFLSAFIETQMFTCFTDNHILATWEEKKEPNLELFEQRLSGFKDEYNDRRLKLYNRHTMVLEGETLIEKRALNADIAPSPHALDGIDEQQQQQQQPGLMPKLNAQVLNNPPKSNNRRANRLAVQQRRSRYSEHLQLQMSIVQKEKYLIEQRQQKNPRPKGSRDINNEHISHTNWKFVETLLKEVKTKTKRILVDKMGQEAFELGHRESLHVGVEENTLIASLCDLLERIWNHGLQAKQGRSALWWHLLSYQEREHFQRRAALRDNNDPALTHSEASHLLMIPPYLIVVSNHGA